MPLSPVRRRGTPALRVMLRRKPLAWSLSGALLSGAATILPAGPLLALVVAGVTGSGAVAAIAREDRRLKQEERLHRRRPLVADLDRAPPPSARRLRAVRRSLVLVGVIGLLLGLGVAAYLGWLASGHVGGSPNQPTWLMLGLGQLFLVGLGAELRRLWRNWRRLGATAASGLARGHVTVLGFTGQYGADVVFVAGHQQIAALLSPVPGEEETADLPTALASVLGWRLGELIPGDVLVCDGDPAEGRVVALATDERTDWTMALRVVPWAQIHEQPALRQITRTAWREGRAPYQERMGYSQGPHGRRAAVRGPDGTLSAPDPTIGLRPPVTDPRGDVTARRPHDPSG